MLQILFPSHGEAEIANCLVCYWNWPEFYGAEGRTKICKNKQKPPTSETLKTKPDLLLQPDLEKR